MSFIDSRLHGTRPISSWWLIPPALGLWCLIHVFPAQAAALETARGEPLLQEAQFTHDVEFRGPVAFIKSTQVIANSSKFEEEAVYTFDLPLDAAVVGLQVRLSDGRTTSMAVMDAGAALTVVPDADGVNAAPDVGLMRLVARDAPRITGPSIYALATYELRVYPVTPGQVITVTTTWVSPLRYDDGRLLLRIPHRGDAGNLVRERVSLRLQPPGGTRGFAAVHGGGKLLGKRIKQAHFTAPPRTDVVIDAEIEFESRSESPLVSFASVPIRDDFGAIGVSVMTPRPSGAAELDYERLLVLVDISRSLENEGLAAAAALSDALLASIPASAEVEVILFDRTAQRVFGSFTRNSPKLRKDLAKALRRGELDNGSDLGAALDLARSVLLQKRPAKGTEPGRRAPTLVTIISDGMLPVALDGRAAADHIGDDLLQDIEIFSIILVPDHAPAPDTDDNPLGKLAYRTPGRATAVRFGEAAMRAKNLASELGRPVPLRAVHIDTGSTAIEGMDIPGILDAGQGYTGLGFYHGPAPQKLTLTASHRNKGLRIEGKRDLGLGQAALPLLLVTASPEDFIPMQDRLEGNSSSAYDAQALEEAKRGLVRAANLSATITPYSAMVALDSKDRFAQDRLALARKWGPGVFFRLPPPAEREPGYELRTYRQRVPESEWAQDGETEQRTGELDRDIIKRLITTYVVPKARVCYEQALRHNNDLRGSLVVVMEIARGEVQHARVEQSTFFPGAGIDACVTDAAYSIQVPRVALGDDLETIGVAHYPLTFKKHNDRGDVQPGKEPPSQRDPTTTGDPLGGLKNP